MRLFHNRIGEDDVLFVVFEHEIFPDRTERRGDVCALFKGEELIGYNFFAFRELVKTKGKGMLVSPNDILIDVLNSRLDNLGFPRLDYVRHTGFKSARILSIQPHPLEKNLFLVELDLGGDKVCAAAPYPQMKAGDMVVVLLGERMRFDGTVFHVKESKSLRIDAEICSKKSLGLGEEDDAPFLIDGYEPGEDFFLK